MPADATKRRSAVSCAAGASFILDSGGVYKVAPDGISGTALRNAGDDVLVCGDKKMINKDNGDKVHVTPVR